MNKKFKYALVISSYVIVLGLGLTSICLVTSKNSEKVSYETYNNISYDNKNYKVYTLEKHDVSIYEKYEGVFNIDSEVTKTAIVDTLIEDIYNKKVTVDTLLGYKDGNEIKSPVNGLVTSVVNSDSLFYIYIYDFDDIEVFGYLDSGYLNDNSKLSTETFKCYYESTLIGNLVYKYIDYSYGIKNAKIKIVFSLLNNENYITGGSLRVYKLVRELSNVLHFQTMRLLLQKKQNIFTHLIMRNLNYILFMHRIYAMITV